MNWDLATISAVAAVVLAIFGIIGTLTGALEWAINKLRQSRRGRSSVDLDVVRTYASRDAVYPAIVKAIREVEGKPDNPKTIFVGALHGHSGKRHLSRFSPNPVFAAFDQEMLRCVKSSGPGMWQVRELYNIATKDRLDEIVSWLTQTENEDGYEVRVFCEPSSITHLAPLVIGNEHAFLGLEDDRYFRVHAGLELRGRTAVALVQRYCDDLWVDPRVFSLRTGYGIDHAQINGLRNQIDRLAPSARTETNVEREHAARM
jgi:hypothetical protein